MYVYDVCVWRRLKEEIAWSIDKWFQYISKIILLRTLIALYSTRPSLQKTQVTLYASRKFEDYSRVGHTMHEQLLTS